jgi:formylglycine-generating enzyme required for sulfatase activity
VGSWIVVANLAGCSLLVPSVDDLSGQSRDASGDPADDVRENEAGIEAATDAATDAHDEALDGTADRALGDAGCPSGRGPTMVAFDGYCIDSTEVTSSQYVDFLASKAGDTSGQAPVCAWNNSYVPNYDWPPANAALPVAGIDWCDAVAFCNWAGKRLCGALDGGAVMPGQRNTAAIDEWFRVCSHRGDGVHAYPYGNVYDATACNTEGASRVDAGSLPGCQGTDPPGVFDLSGNVLEWEDSCISSGGSADAAVEQCYVRGGSMNSSPGGTMCSSGFDRDRSYAIALVGFRCCT